MKRETGWLDRPDCRLYYEVAGEGPPLVFLHGLGGNHLSWWQQVPHFAPRFTCVTLSHRGFFPSTAPAEGADPAAFAADLAAVVAKLGLEGVVLVAQSMGGWTALEYAFSSPPALRGLVLSATSGRIDPTGLPGFAAWAESSATALAAGAARGEHPAAGPRMATEQPPLHYLYRAMDELSTLDKLRMRTRLGASRDRPPSDLAAIAVPTLWLTGEADIVFPSPVAPALAAAMPHGSHVQIPQVGHSGYFEDAPAFNAALDRFLAAL